MITNVNRMETEIYDFFTRNRRRIRVSILLLSMFFQLGALVLGSTVSLTEDEANKKNESLPSIISWKTIVFHNMKVTMLNFLPLLGIWEMGYVSFNTGIALKAIATIYHRPATTLLFTITVFPHYWLEEFASSIALTAGLMFFLSLFTSKRSVIFHEVKCLIASITAWATILTVASFLEVTDLAILLWIVLHPLIASILEKASGDSLRFSGKTKQAIFLVVLFAYFTLWIIFSYIFQLPLFGVAMYILLGYYLFETLTNGWFRRQILGFEPLKRDFKMNKL